MTTTLIKGGTVVSATGRGEADVLIDGETIAAVLARDPRADAEPLARVVSAAMFLSMAASLNVETGVDGILEQIRSQVQAVLGR